MQEAERQKEGKKLTLRLQSGGVESDDARVCSDHLPYVPLFM